jgi:hypothetical protein
MREGDANRYGQGRKTRRGRLRNAFEETKKETYSNVQNVDESIGPGRTGAGETNGRSREEVAYFAQTLADKLGDRKSLTYYKLLCARFDPHQLLQKAVESGYEHSPYSSAKPPRPSAPKPMPNPALPGSRIGTTNTMGVRAGRA